MPGLYRMTWPHKNEWPQSARIRVEASPKILDPWLDLGDLRFPALLTIGRATNIRARLRQHFGTNHNNNRLTRKLMQLFKNTTHEELCATVVRNVEITWAVVPSWVDRALLENYGCAVFRPVLDLGAEH